MTKLISTAMLLLLAAPTLHAQKTRDWLQCLAPNECRVKVVTVFTGRVAYAERKATERAASACVAAGYSHYQIGPLETELGGYSAIVVFTHSARNGARECSFSSDEELVMEAERIAVREGYEWESYAEASGWTFEPGENDWGERVPFLDEISSPIVPAMRSDQDDLVGLLSLGRNCSVTLLVGRIGSDPESDWWAYWDGGIDLDDQILEIRVDGASVKEQGRNATKPTAGMVMSSRQTFGVYVRSAEHEDNAAFNWPVTDRDREVVEKHFPHCLP